MLRLKEEFFFFFLNNCVNSTNPMGSDFFLILIWAAFICSPKSVTGLISVMQPSYQNSCDFAVSPQDADNPKDTQIMHKNTLWEHLGSWMVTAHAAWSQLLPVWFQPATFVACHTPLSHFVDSFQAWLKITRKSWVYPPEISEDAVWTCRKVLNYSVLLTTCLDRNGAGTGAVV